MAGGKVNSVDVTAPVVVASVAMSAAAVPSMAWSAASVVSTSAWAMSTVPEGVMVFAIVKATLVPDGMAFVAVVIVSVLAASLLHTAAPPTLAGEVKLMVHRLCQPCTYLEKKLKQPSLKDALWDKGGVKCEILTDGNIKPNDKILLLS